MSNLMDDRKRRRKTGCLTCRLRRVKCDEERPMCHRCLVANLECAGYEERRRLDTDKLRRTSSKRQHQVSGAVEHQQRLDHRSGVNIPYLLVQHREDGLPLIGLPNNPTSSQRPHTRGRDILAYHQFLFRTLAILFPSQHMAFWRDYICQQYWEYEYVYDAITALGSMHRAVLMLSQSGQNDQDRGFDTKVIACQAYATLQEMATAKKNTMCFVAVAVFCAYFECFAGNVLAATRHFHTSNHYARLINSDDIKQAEVYGIAIESALRDLALICAINLPFTSEVQSTRFSIPLTSQNTATARSNWIGDTQSLPSMIDMLQSLMNISSEDNEIQGLIWNPTALCLKPTSVEKLQYFYTRLDEWKGILTAMLLTYGLGLPLLPPEDLTWESFRQLPIPPLPYSEIPTHLRLILSLYTFYAGRMQWMMSVHDRKDCLDHELEAYFYFYQLLRLASTDLSSFTTYPIKHASQHITTEPYYACESVKIGFSPLLYIAGQCCHRIPTWIDWVSQRLSEIGQEGLFNGHIYAKNLEAIHRFRRLSRMNDIGATPPFSQCQSNSQPVLSLLIPYCRRRAYAAYYTRPSSKDTERGVHARDNERHQDFDVIGISGWGDDSRDLIDMTIDNANKALNESFGTEWLMDQPIVREWTEWSLNPEFKADLVLADHIVGGSLDRNSEYKCTEVVLYR